MFWRWYKKFLCLCFGHEPQIHPELSNMLSCERCNEVLGGGAPNVD